MKKLYGYLLFYLIDESQKNKNHETFWNSEKNEEFYKKSQLYIGYYLFILKNDCQAKI